MPFRIRISISVPFPWYECILFFLFFLILSVVVELVFSPSSCNLSLRVWHGNGGDGGDGGGIFWIYTYFLILMNTSMRTFGRRIYVSQNPAVPANRWDEHKKRCAHKLKVSLDLSMSRHRLYRFDLHNALERDDVCVHASLTIHRLCVDPPDGYICMPVAICAISGKSFVLA